MVRYRSSDALISPWRVRPAWPHSAQRQQRVEPAATGLHVMLAVCALQACQLRWFVAASPLAWDRLCRIEPLYCTAAEVGRAGWRSLHAAEDERERRSGKTHLLRCSQAV